MKDRLHKDHYEVYKNKRDFEKGKRDRAVWDDGRLKQEFESMAKKITPDVVCEQYAQKATALTIRKLDASSVLIEGDRTSLQFLGDLIHALATSHGDDGFEISPRGPGSLHFAKGKSLGIYLHRLTEGQSAKGRTKPRTGGTS